MDRTIEWAERHRPAAGRPRQPGRPDRAAAGRAQHACRTGRDTSNASIKVAVYNGTINNGLAGKATEQLKAAEVRRHHSGPGGEHQVQDHHGRVRGRAEGERREGRRAVLGRQRRGRQLAGRDPDRRQGLRRQRRHRGPGAGGTTGAAASGTATGAPTPPAPLPTTVTNDARSADDDICANTTYGSGG